MDHVAPAGRHAMTHDDRPWIPCEEPTSCQPHAYRNGSRGMTGPRSSRLIWSRPCMYCGEEVQWLTRLPIKTPRRAEGGCRQWRKLELDLCCHVDPGLDGENGRLFPARALHRNKPGCPNSAGRPRTHLDGGKGKRPKSLTVGRLKNFPMST